jgi:hypothetical protein
MRWEQLKKPYKGLHWWYRILTGTKYTFPYMNQRGYKVYWKTIPNEFRDYMLVGKKYKTYEEYLSSLEVECTILNLISRIKFWIKRTKRKLYENDTKKGKI